MSRQDVEILRGVYERWAEGDFASREAFDPEVEHARIGRDVPAGPGGPGQWRGIDEMWRGFADWLRHWDGVRVGAEEFIDLGDRVLVLSRQTGRGKLSGVPVENQQADIVTLRDGKIVRWEAYWDRAEAKHAAGLEQPPPEA